MPKHYRPVDPTAPISQGDIFRDVPNVLVSFDHHLIESDETFQLESLTGEIQNGLLLPAQVELANAIVLTQSCDAPRADTILLAPLSPVELSNAKPENQWNEIQKLATSLHQPTRCYLPDDPSIGLERSIVEMSEAFTISREGLEHFAEQGKRVATLGEEGVAYLSFRIAMMFWRVARDDYAWPSKADLSLRKLNLEARIRKQKDKIDQTRNRLEKENSDELMIELQVHQEDFKRLEEDLKLTIEAEKALDAAP